MKKTIYLYKSGELQRRDYSLILKQKNDNIIYIPIEQINTIVCFGEITLNKRVLGLLNTYNVILLFYNYYGNYIGRFTPKKYIDGKILLEQVKSFEDSRRLYLAKTIIQAETKNCLQLLKYYDKKTHLYSTDISTITEILNEIDNSNSIEELLLLEAQIKKEYYSCFDLIIKNNNFIFKKRSYYPPLNEVNAMLSYGYSLLYSNILSDIDRSPLVPNISYIHSLSKESDSLQYDIADMFKSVYIDRLVFRLINKKQISIDCFEYKENGACYMNKKGIKIFITEYEKLMTKPIKIGNKYYSYRNLLTREVFKLSKYLKGKTKEYKPYIMEW